MAADKGRLVLPDGCKLGGMTTWFIRHTIMLEAIYLHHVVFHKITSLVPTGLLLLGSLALGEMPNIRVTEPAGDYFGTSSYYDDNANVSRALDALLFGYDKRLRPHYRKKPVEVGITMHISSVSSISEVDMDFTVDFYFRQFWHDPRLAHDLLAEEVCISTEMLQRMWWPDTFFANAKNAKFHTATTKNAFLRIQPNGYVLLSLRLTVTAMCRMDLKYFPMDSQVCPLEIESFGYQLKDIGYKWQDGPGRSVKFETGVHVLPQFKVKGHRQVQRVIGTSTGNYSRLSCEFFFVRSMGYYLIQIYIPSILIVVLSWVSFWLSREAVPARVALGITTVLTMTTLISSTNAALPKISYLKSIDVYLVTCFVMVFASLLEYAAVSYIGNRCKKKLLNSRAAVADSCGKEGRSNGRLTNGALMSRSASSHSNGPQPAYDTEVRITSLRKLHTECDLRAISAGNYFRGETGSCICRRQPRPPELPAMPPGGEIHGSMCMNACTCTKPSAIDKYSRFLFPLIFLCFNIMYWLTYMSVSVHPDEKYFTSVH